MLAIVSPKNIEAEKKAEKGTININDDALCDPSLIVVIKYAVVPNPRAITDINIKLYQNNKSY